MHQINAYGLWTLVILNSLVFIIFAFSFTMPKSPRDWRSFGAFSAFIIALFTEMYGFPLIIYLLSGWLQSPFPKLTLTSHDAGHLWWTLLGMKGDPHSNPLHLLSNIFILGGTHPPCRRMAGAVQSAAEPHASRYRALRSDSSPAVRCLYGRHAWLPAAMADHTNSGDVSDSRGDVCPACPT